MTDWLDNASPDVRALNPDLYGEPDRPALTPEQGARDPERAQWDAFRRNVLNANGWTNDSPGVWTHEETGAAFMPFDMWRSPSGTIWTRWRLYEMMDEAPDPHESHMERRQMDYERVRAMEAQTE